MAILFRQLFDRQSCTYTYLLADRASRKALLIDPVHEHYDRDRSLLEELELELVHTVETHVHADHVTAAARLRAALGSTAIIPARGGAAGADRGVEDGEIITLGSLRLEAIGTPGHTSGCTSYFERDSGRLYTGDTLFVRGCGRTDFQQGDAGTLYDSVTQKLFPLGDDVIVLPGHDYKGRTSSTLGEERKHNPRLNETQSREDFIATMAGLKLAYPAKIQEALPANLQAGVRKSFQAKKGMPAAEVDVAFVRREGKRFLVVDVRDEDERQGPMGAIEESICAPLGQLEEHAKQWDRADAVVTVCGVGKRSLMAAAALREMGFCEVASMAGGMRAWNEAGFPPTLG